jgi:ADP-ribosylglycohydrolase
MIYETIRWIMGLPLVAYSLYSAGFNFWEMFIMPRCLPPGERGASPIIMIGGLFGMIGLLALPLPELHPWAWLPLVLDVGCLPLLGRMEWINWRDTRGVLSSEMNKPHLTEETIDAKRQRAIAGCLLGTAVGDAIGLPFEGLSRQRVARWLRGSLHHRFFFGHGFCSDDTEHTCLVAQALLTARQSSNPNCYLPVFTHNLAWRLRIWLLGLPAGIGLATLKSLLKQWLYPLSHTKGVFSAGNAPAMRSGILGVCHGDTPLLLCQLVRASTRLTHTDPRAEHGALAIACAAHLASHPDPITPERFMNNFALLLSGEGCELLAAVNAAVESVKLNESTADFAARNGSKQGVSGFVMHTVPVALHVWLSHPEDYAGAIETVVRCGGDTDTMGAIVGGLVGARVGPDGIPIDWREGLWEWPRSRHWLEILATRLADTRQGTRWRGALPLNLPGLLLRNVLFMGWVLAHGFRRLLPPY